MEMKPKFEEGDLIVDLLYNKYFRIVLSAKESSAGFTKYEYSMYNITQGRYLTLPSRYVDDNYLLCRIRKKKDKK